MFKFVIAFFITVFLSACGVDTSSSASESGIEVSTDSDLVVSNPIDLNPITDGSDISDGSDDSDTTDGTDATDGSDGSDGTDGSNSIESDFDIVDALEDPNACTTAGYRAESDASFNGDGTGENGADSFVIVDQGLVIRSEYYAQENDKTWITLYYKRFPTPNDLYGNGATASYKMDEVFYISYDFAWADESIPDIDNRMYIQSNIGEKPSCYRLDLNHVVGTQIDVQKVYRVKI